MSIHRVTLDIPVDDETLKAHLADNPGEAPPYDADVSEWDGTDYFRAVERGIVVPGEVAIHFYEGQL